MPAKPLIDVVGSDTFVELSEALSFSVSNTGEALAQIAFELTGTYADLPPNSSLHFEFTGARYEGRLYVRFPAATGDQLPLTKKVSIIKITHHC